MDVLLAFLIGAGFGYLRGRFGRTDDERAAEIALEAARRRHDCAARAVETVVKENWQLRQDAKRGIRRARFGEDN